MDDEDQAVKNSQSIAFDGCRRTSHNTRSLAAVQFGCTEVSMLHESPAGEAVCAEAYRRWINKVPSRERQSNKDRKVRIRSFGLRWHDDYNLRVFLS